MKLTKEDIKKYATDKEKNLLKEKIEVQPLNGKVKDSKGWLGTEYHMDVLKSEEGYTSVYKTKKMNQCASCEEDGDGIEDYGIDWIDWYVDSNKGIAVRRGSCGNGHGIFEVFKYMYTESSGESTY